MVTTVTVSVSGVIILWCVIKFVIPSKEIHDQMRSNLRTSIYCKMRLVDYMVQDELRNKSTGIIHNELIMQWED